MSEKEAKVPVRKCRLSRTKKREAIQRFMREYGDDLPEDVIQKSTDDENIGTWTTYCDKEGIVAAARWEQNDWYLCTLKNAAVRENMRGKGIGKKLYPALMRNALKNKSCLVLAGDVTYDNIASKKLLEKMGFKAVNRFCWKEGKKPADVMHYVRIPPRSWNRCGKQIKFAKGPKGE